MNDQLESPGNDSFAARYAYLSNQDFRGETNVEKGGSFGGVSNTKLRAIIENKFTPPPV